MDVIDPQLPWGYWFRIEYRERKDVFIDGDGREFATLREAFWRGRLDMPPVNGGPPSDQLELMHAVLAFRIRSRGSGNELANDLFGGNLLVHNVYLDWLANVGLLCRNYDERRPSGATDEGHSVLLMLDATRPHSTRRMRPSAPSIAFLAGLAEDTVVGEARRQRVEAAAAEWDVAFFRRPIGAKAGIVLQRRGDGPVPVMQTIWSVVFETVRLRDAFYDWICSRVDRWAAWSQISRYREGSELTQHLLVVLAGSLADDSDGMAPPAQAALSG